MTDSPKPYTLPPGAVLVEAGTIMQAHLDAGGRWAWTSQPNERCYSRPRTDGAVLFWPPPPVPTTERVPWWEALRDRRRTADHRLTPHQITSGGYMRDGDTPYLFCGVGGLRIDPDPDGTVEVLAPEPDPAPEPLTATIEVDALVRLRGASKVVLDEDHSAMVAALAAIAAAERVAP